MTATGDVYLLRGVPGCGKSHLAALLAPVEHIHSADRYAVDEDDRYHWNPKRASDYHARNLEAYQRDLEAGAPVIVCDNTNVQGKHWQPYADAAKAYGYRVHVVHVEAESLAACAARNAHGVTLDQIEAMAARFEPRLRLDDEGAGWLDAAEDRVAEGLVTLAKQGSVPAANTVIKLLAEKRAQAWAAEHRATVERLQATPAALAEYLGTLGQSTTEAAAMLGRPLKPDELADHARGALRRTLEVRAIELARLRNGDGKVADWMTRKARSK